ncbi:MAG: hypothetical protein V3S14_16070, partial [Anaerolineae bacterium]
MLILVIGAKGGVGTTSLARHLAQAGNGIGLDLCDGQLSAFLEHKTWSLAGIAFATGQERQRAIDRIVNRRISLLWTPECNLVPDSVWNTVRDVANRAVVVADCGTKPLGTIVDLADTVIVVSKDDPVAQYHEGHLQECFP